MHFFEVKDTALMAQINAMTMPQHLTNAIINGMGSWYVDEFGKTESWFSFFSRNHNNHNLAQDLKEYKEPTAIQAKWNFLISIYATLSNNNGQLASLIVLLFRKSFKDADDYLRSKETDTPQKMSAVLQEITDHYFYPTYSKPSLPVRTHSLHGLRGSR